jgi:hypothetical protein
MFYLQRKLICSNSSTFVSLMKKTAIIFLVFIYALSITGVALKADYCCNNLKSIKVVLTEDAKNTDGCCAVKYQSFKIKDAHAASDIVTAPALSYTFIHTLHSYFEINDSGFDNTTEHLNIHAPPLFSLTPLYISNCTYRI